MVNACDVCEVFEQCAEACNRNETRLPVELEKLAACNYESHAEYAKAIGKPAYVIVKNGEVVEGLD